MAGKIQVGEESQIELVQKAKSCSFQGMNWPSGNTLFFLNKQLQKVQVKDLWPGKKDTLSYRLKVVAFNEWIDTFYVWLFCWYIKTTQK